MRSLGPKTYFIAAMGLFLVVHLFGNNQFINANKPAGVVPMRLKNVEDPRFKNIIDTVYYGDKPFSGYQYQLYPTGDTAFIKPYLNGLEEGKIRKWYPNRQLAEERYYTVGRKEGIHRAWWPNGKPKFRYEFKNDEFNGINKEWYETGTLFKEFHYKNGHEDGSQKMYWINGKVRANYMIKNNRRYGLLGTKNCINVADSIFVRP